MPRKRTSRRPSRSGGRNKQKEIAPNRSKKGQGDKKPRKPKDQSKANDAKTKKDKMRDPSTIAALAGLGLTAAMVTKIGVEALNDYMASDGASFSISSITPHGFAPEWIPDWDWLKKLFPKPTKLKISYNVTATGIENNPAILVPDVFATKNNVKVLDKDTVDISGTGIAGIDKSGVPVLSAPIDGGYFIIDSGMKDSSNVNVSNLGTGIIHTDMDDHVGDAIDENASDVLSSVNRIFGSVTDNLSTIIFIVAFCIIVYFIYSIFR